MSNKVWLYTRDGVSSVLANKEVFFNFMAKCGWLTPELKKIFAPMLDSNDTFFSWKDNGTYCTLQEVNIIE